MDCHKLEASLMDELYGETDEVTSAAVKRHVAGCSHCAALLTGFRATRRVAVLPLIDPPPDLEHRILKMAGVGATVMPLKRHFARAVSAAGSWAMRPQTAMAAVFLVMLGASVLLLRGRSSRAPASAEMIVTEKGTPAPAPLPVSPRLADEVAGPETPPASSRPTARGSGSLPAGAPVDLGTGAARDRAASRVVAAAAKADDGPLALRGEPTSNNAGLPPSTAPAAAPGGGASRPARDVGAFENSGVSTAAGTALVAARSVRDSQGCRAAVSRFDDVAQRAAGSAPGWEALLESARCYRSLGDNANARSRLMTLLGVLPFRDRARAELDMLDRAAATQAQP